LITEDGFPSIEARREYFDNIAIAAGSLLEPNEDYCSVLEKTIPYMRNFFAHPEMKTILMPSYGVHALVLATEFINPLFNSSVSTPPSV
jgi:hypothetical protein